MLLVVLWRLRYTLRLRDLAEMFLPRGVVFTHGVKQRYYPMRGFSNVAAAGRFCRAYEEQRQYFRARTTLHERIPLADQRRRFRDRWVAALSELVTT